MLFLVSIHKLARKRIRIRISDITSVGPHIMEAIFLCSCVGVSDQLFESSNGTVENFIIDSPSRLTGMQKALIHALAYIADDSFLFLNWGASQSHVLEYF